MPVVIMLSCTGNHPGVMIYDQIEPVEFFFFFLSLMGGTVIS